MRMCTLHDIAMNEARTAPGMIDAFTEEARILDKVKWIQATHEFEHRTQQISEVKGPDFTRLDGALPIMMASTDLLTTELGKAGGTIEVPTERAMQMGGPVQYFAKYADIIIREWGNKVERTLVNGHWLKAALDCGNVIDAGGGTGPAVKDTWFLLFVRFDDLCNVGLYNPKMFKGGRFFDITYPYGQNEHMLHSPEYAGTLGYSIVYRTYIGYLLLDVARHVGAIVNIDKDHKPTQTDIDRMLIKVRAQPGTTYIMGAPSAKLYGLDPYKEDHIQLANSDTDAKTRIETWNGISILTSYTIEDPGTKLTRFTSKM